MFITIIEIIYLAILVLAVGYVFSDIIQRPGKEDVLERYKSKKYFNWNGIKYAALIAAPGIVLHELAHKFVAIGFGLNAEFFIWPTGIAIGIILKVLNTGFILLAPGYVAISNASLFQSAIISFAGPLINCLIWLGCLLYLKYKKKINRNIALGLMFTGQINKWLFIFNLIPIPPLDGFKVFYYLIHLTGLL
jgi:Zn-dependent protease